MCYDVCNLTGYARYVSCYGVRATNFPSPVKQLDLSTRSSPIPVASPPDRTPNRCYSADPRPAKKSKSNRSSRWAQFIESIETLARDNDTSDSQTPESDKRDLGFLDFLRKKEDKVASEAVTQKRLSKSLASSPLKIDLPKRSPILKYFEPKPSQEEERPLQASNTVEGDAKPTLPKRRSSTPCTLKTKLARKRISDLRHSGFKTDSENDDVTRAVVKLDGGSEVICDTSNSVLITKTAPSVERFACSSSSTTDGCDDKPGRR